MLSQVSSENLSLHVHRPTASSEEAEPSLQTTLLSQIPLQAGSGQVRWLGQGPSTSEDAVGCSSTLIGWMASENRCATCCTRLCTDLHGAAWG